MEMNNNVIDTSQKLKDENGKLKDSRDASMIPELVEAQKWRIVD